MSSTKIIVNADDFGFYSCVSKGILYAHSQGIVTATGVMANGPVLDKYVNRLLGASLLDVGIHLNLTMGKPVHSGSLEELADSNGKFIGKMELLRRIALGKISPLTIEKEWEAQIEKCYSLGLGPIFMNSHEHVHMFPRLFRVFMRLAKKYEIEFVRIPYPVEIFLTKKLEKIARDLPLWILANKVRENRYGGGIKFIGLYSSGKLSKEYLQFLLSSLKNNTTYELMCHPGFYDKDEISNKDLLSYHDWEKEINTLTSKEIIDAISINKFTLCNYSQLLNEK